MNSNTLTAKIATFAAAHPNAVVCALYRKTWRDTDKLTHLYFEIRDGQPERIPPQQKLGTSLPRYTLDIEHGQAWRDYTGGDVYRRLISFAHINETYLNDREYEKLHDACQAVALKLNRWLKNHRIAEMRRKGMLA